MVKVDGVDRRLVVDRERHLKTLKSHAVKEVTIDAIRERLLARLEPVYYGAARVPAKNPR